MCNLNIGSNMQALISCACFIRGVDQETFFPWHFEQANTILHRLRKGKIPFVLCQHKHFNLRLSLLSKQQISSEARRDTRNACGSFNLSLISRGSHTSFRMASMFLSVSGGMHKSKGEGKVQVCQCINSRQDRRLRRSCEVLKCLMPFVGEFNRCFVPD